MTPVAGRLQARLLYAAAAVPPILVAVAVARTAVDLPFWDQWQFAPQLLAAAEGRLDPRELWAQHNEHRILFTRLLMLGLAALSGWDVRWEMAGAIGLNLITLALLARTFGHAVRPSFPALAPWLVLAASLLTFSPSAWLNWIWGWQIQILLHLLAVAWTAMLLVDWDGTWPRLLAILGLAALALGSFASGFALLALLPPAAAGWPDTGARRARVTRGVVTAAACMTMAGLYLADFHYPSHHPSPARSLADLPSYLGFVFAYLGAGFAAGSVQGAIRWGALGTLLLLACATRLAFAGPAYRRAVAISLFFGGYAILNAIITGLGRAGVGLGYALSSHYVSISASLWIGVTLVAALVTAREFSTPVEAGRGRLRRLVVASVACGALASMAIGYHGSWVRGRAAMTQQRAKLHRLRACLQAPETARAGCLERLTPLPGEVVGVARALAAHGLGPLR